MKGGDFYGSEQSHVMEVTIIVIASIDRVAELGSLSSGAKMAMKIFVKRVFTIFASNESFCA